MTICNHVYQQLVIYASLFFAGLLAGEELAICYGVRTPLAQLAGKPQAEFRQLLIVRLRILVPMIFVAAAMAEGLALSLPAQGLALSARGVGILMLAVWAATTFVGTVPINQVVLTWNPSELPCDWQMIQRRWERLDIVRCWASVFSFACVLIAAAADAAAGQ